MMSLTEKQIDALKLSIGHSVKLQNLLLIWMLKMSTNPQQIK
jgi:hypothetical protein